MAEAIGAEIFIDTWAMVNPGNPELAADMARKAAQVSHDGLAVEAAVLLAAMEAEAFVQHDINKLIDTGLKYARDETLARVVGEVRNQVAKASHWRDVRQWLEENHSYRHYSGCCPMMPNHALLLASFIMGGDNFQEGLKIAVSSGWDTDCNAGNLGCLNGIRLGIKALEEGPDFRGPVSDLLYLVSSDGGDCLSDAVLETRRVRRTAAALGGYEYHAPFERFAFEYPGSVQGFQPCPLHDGRQAITAVGNLNTTSEINGLELRFDALAAGVKGSVSVPTFIDQKPRAAAETSYFEVLASPSIYGTQTVNATIRVFDAEGPSLCLYIVHYDGDGNLAKVPGEPIQLTKGDNAISWPVPDVRGLPIHRIGLELSAGKRLSGRIALLNMDWAAAPKAFIMGRAHEMSPRMTPFDTSSYWMKSFVSSALHFRPDLDTTFALSHPFDNGAITTGSRDWVDYEVRSRLTLDLHKSVGLIVRARGHRRYYAGVVENQVAKIIKRVDDTVTVLAQSPYAYEENAKLHFKMAVKGTDLTFSIGDRELIKASDEFLVSGGAGFLIEQGTVLAMGFEVRALS